jgi:hypothetical protein
MTSWRIVHLLAGALVLASVSLGAPGSPLYASGSWLALTAFVGANLLQSAFTRWCLLEAILRKLGIQGGC